jgi:hypothetical protein
MNCENPRGAASESDVQGGAAVPRLRGMSGQRTRNSAVARRARLAHRLQSFQKLLNRSGLNAV